jgi:hypothetical protein
MLKTFRNKLIPGKYYHRSIQFFICLLVFSPICSYCQSLTGAEYEVKMGFIYNFANFVTWPKEAFKGSDDKLYFCFFSDQPAANVLFKLHDQPIQNRKLTVSKIGSEISDEKCNILFFGTDDETYIRQTLAFIRGQHILTIGEVQGFAQMGGIINFFNQNNKLRFEVNIDAAKRENLKFSAQLLQAAQIVEETEEDRQAQKAEVEKLKQDQEAEQPENTEGTIETDLSEEKEEDSKPGEAEQKPEQKRKVAE